MNQQLRVTTELLSLAACLALAVGGLYAMDAYSARPGAIIAADARPRDAFCEHHHGPYRLTMFVHARCPCTRASLIELRRIVDRSPSELRTEVVSVEPESAPPEWRNAPNLIEAATIPGVVVRHVTSPVEPASCGALTSGHIVLYDSCGRELFRGGITRSRGHEGPSEGSRAVLAMLAGDTHAIAQHSVFGCPLYLDAPAALAAAQRLRKADADAADLRMP